MDVCFNHFYLTLCEVLPGVISQEKAIKAYRLKHIKHFFNCYQYEPRNLKKMLLELTSGFDKLRDTKKTWNS